MSVIFSFTAVLLLVLPWLNPLAAGPSPAVQPWLISLASNAILILTVYLFKRTNPSTGVQPTSPQKALYKWWQVAALAWLCAGILSSAISLLQYFGFADQFTPWISGAKLGEAYANLRQRNQFASLTNMALVAILALLAGTRLASGRLFAWFAIAAVALLATGNAASSSRTGLLQLLLVGVLFGTWGHWRNRQVRNVLLLAVLVYALAIVALPWLAGADLSVQGMLARLRAGDSVCASRITLWSNVLHLIAQKPWLGWGWGELDYAHYVTLYDGARFCDILDNAHNLPLHLAVELGVPVALLVCGALVWWVCSQRPWNERHPARQLAWAVLALIGLHSLLEYPLWYGPFQMAVGLCLYLLWRNPCESVTVVKTSKYASNSALAPVARSLLAIIVIATSGYAAWDYRRISQIYLAPSARDADYRDDTLSKIRDSRLFRNQVLFAELGLTPLTPNNAQWTFETASALLHFSPEPKVIEKLIESATMLGDDQTALFQLVRFRVAFPQDYQKWSDLNKQATERLQKL